MMIRLLQAFKEITWDPEASPQSLPPPEWATSDNLRKREEKLRPRSHLTLYAKVSIQLLQKPDRSLSNTPLVLSEWILGEVQGG